MSNSVPADLKTRERVPSLVVRVVGLKHAGGRVIARLYRPGQSVLAKDPFARATAEIEGDTALCELFDLEEGPYALVVFHDENDNGVVDHKRGRPVEPLGFSNGFKLSLFSGPPTFERLRFELRRERPDLPMTMEVEVR